VPGESASLLLRASVSSASRGLLARMNPRFDKPGACLALLLLSGVSLAPLAVQGQEISARELRQLREKFQAYKRASEERIRTLEEKLATTEARTAVTQQRVVKNGEHGDPGRHTCPGGGHVRETRWGDQQGSTEAFTDFGTKPPKEPSSFTGTCVPVWA
jgi:hypothetical protein